jgi:hypothetical protein
MDPLAPVSGSTLAIEFGKPAPSICSGVLSVQNVSFLCQVPVAILSMPFTTASEGMYFAQVCAVFSIQVGFFRCGQPVGFLTIPSCQIACVVILGALTYAKVNYWLRFPFFALCAWAAGLNVGSWVQAALQEVGFCKGSGWHLFPDLDFFAHPRLDNCNVMNDMVMEALALSIGLYLCFAASAWLFPRSQWPTWMATFIFCGLWILFATDLLARFGSTSFLIQI